MSVCPKCNTVNEDGVRFCIGCGSPMEQPAPAEEVTPVPVQEEIPSQEQAPVQEEAPAQEAAEPVVEAHAKKKKKGKKWLLAGGIVAGVVALVAAAVFALQNFFGISVLELIFGPADPKEQVFYIKEDNLFYRNLKDKKSIELTSKLLKDKESVIDDYNNYYLATAIQMNKKETRIFFPEKMSHAVAGDQYSGYCYTLYYLDIEEKDAEPKRVAGDVRSYLIDEAGEKVVYMEENTLYLSDLKSEEKIAKNVTGYYASKDLKRIGYMNDEGNLYLWQEGKDEEKIASSVSSIEHINEDLTLMYYMKEGSLYKQELGAEDREKIGADVADCWMIDTGEVYYITAQEETYKITDYIDDDMARQDEALTEPEYPDAPEYPEAPVYPSYTTDEEAYEAAKEQYEQDKKVYDEEVERLKKEYEDAVEQYEAAKEKYVDKQARDALRTELEGMEATAVSYSLYYYDGKESVMVTDTMGSYWGMSRSYEKPVAIVQLTAKDQVQKVKLSEIDYASNAVELVNQARSAADSTSYALVSKKLLSPLEHTENMQSFRLNGSGSAIYYLADVEENVGDLYKITVKDGKAGKAQLYDKDVYSDSFDVYNESGAVVYYKDVESQEYKEEDAYYTSYVRTGTLYINKKQVSEDVYVGSDNYYEGAWYYRTDYDYEKKHGTLNRYQDGKSTQISEEVHSYGFTAAGDILYLYDFSQKDQCGTLYRYNNGKPKKIDDEVQLVITYYNLIRDYFNYYSGYAYGG